MTSEPDRDEALERLLREPVPSDNGIGGTGAVVEAGETSDHLDAETAAAWVERRLGPREVAAIESHVSACDRCQELVAMIVRTTPAAAAAEARPRWRLAWLVPIGATAAGVAIWFAVGQRADRTVFVERTAEQTAAAPVERVAPPDTRPDSRQAARSDEPMGAASRGAANEHAPVDQAKQSITGKTAEPQGHAAAESIDSLQKADASAGAGAPATNATAVPPTNAAAPETARRATSSLPVTSAQARNDALALSARNGVDVLSVDPAERWRFGGPGVMQHSIDGGRTWDVAPIASDLQITGGSSPAASVCWLAGRAGVVMLTTDGQTWRRLPFPIADDLVSIIATDARTATVTTADGRRVQTADGGQTWR